MMTIRSFDGEPVTRWNRSRKGYSLRRYAIKPQGKVFAELPETTNILHTTEDDDTEGGRAEFVTKIAERFKGNGRI